ncbi:MAG: hypothetical protein BRC26_02960 [Nanohaloarchaea archaeon QH_8_44_6]|nr:MAG: hypothetical protein BRC26_02960 [Nanohaloarchaea archaeon QH_8_44_6]
MVEEEVDLSLDFSNDELANFLENFADKLRDGNVGLSFKGRNEVNIEPSGQNKVKLRFFETNNARKLNLNVKLEEEVETTQEGRRKIQVKVV